MWVKNGERDGEGNWPTRVLFFIEDGMVQRIRRMTTRFTSTVPARGSQYVSAVLRTAMRTAIRQYGNTHPLFSWNAIEHHIWFLLQCTTPTGVFDR